MAAGFPRQVRNLSGGELQRVAITLALGMPADIYLIDEVSAAAPTQAVLSQTQRAHRKIMWRDNNQ
jgi:ATP-binding cassette subfamily E protein 1